jgi:integrase
MYKADKEYRRLKRRIRASGKATWVYLFSFHGRDRCYTIGDVKLTQARTIAAWLQNEIAQQRDPQAEKMAQRSAGTFSELYDRFLHEYAKRENKAWAQPDYLVRKHLLPRWGKLNAKAITRPDARAALGKISSDSVRRQTHAAGSKVFAWGMKEEIVTQNPFAGIERTETNARERSCSNEEIKLLWPHLTDPLRVMMLTGQRGIEVIHMLREHIKDGDWWEMPGEEVLAPFYWPGTKNGEFHRVWLPPQVRELIGDGNSGYVFKRRPLDREMRDISKRLAIADPIRPHDLRRTWTTMAARLGIDDKTIDRILNHPDRSVTKVHYNRYRYEREDAAAMEKVAAAILEPAEGRSTDNVVRLR